MNSNFYSLLYIKDRIVPCSNNKTQVKRNENVHIVCNFNCIIYYSSYTSMGITRYCNDSLVKMDNLFPQIIVISIK